MKQVRGETHQQEQPSTPLRCPRCNSLDTKFRYFNNHSSTQPRHHCNTCNRQWTACGNLRNIPPGGKPRSGNRTKASSSRSANPRSHPPQPPLLPLQKEYLQNSQSLTPMETITPQNSDTAMIQPFINLPATRFPLSTNYFNDEIACLDAIQSLFQPDITNQYPNAGNEFVGGGQNMATPQEWSMHPKFVNQQVLGGNEFVLGGANVEIPQEWSIQPKVVNQHVLGGNEFIFSGENMEIPQELSIQPEVVNQHVFGGNEFVSSGASMPIPQEWSMEPEINQQVLGGYEFVSGGANTKIPLEWSIPTTSQQALPQQNPGDVETYQTHFQVNDAPLSQSHNNSLVQPTWPMNSFPADVTDNFSFPTSNACLGNNFSGNITNTEMDTTSVNVDEWLNFPSYGPP